MCHLLYIWKCICSFRLNDAFCYYNIHVICDFWWTFDLLVLSSKPRDLGQVYWPVYVLICDKLRLWRHSAKTKWDIRSWFWQTQTRVDINNWSWIEYDFFINFRHGLRHRQIPWERYYNSDKDLDKLRNSHIIKLLIRVLYASPPKSEIFYMSESDSPILISSWQSPRSHKSRVSQKYTVLNCLFGFTPIFVNSLRSIWHRTFPRTLGQFRLS